ncbi:hypothetical protein GOBAR_DD12675 [Gossypium barbadense]|nr:hypothetical protein GOBAR_DD12675 [Gossypium barbadense]
MLKAIETGLLWLGFEQGGDEVELDVQKPLRRGIFILVGSQENLSGFCFGCGCMAHRIKECNDTSANFKELPEDNLPFSLALKAESNLMGKKHCVIDFFMFAPSRILTFPIKFDSAFRAREKSKLSSGNSLKFAGVSLHSFILCAIHPHLKQKPDIFILKKDP